MTGKDAITAPAISAIVIHGGALEIWSAAALLARELPENISLTLIDTAQTYPAHALSFNSDNAFHNRAGTNELELIGQCDGTLSLGKRYTGWRGDGSDYFDAPAGKLPGLNGIALHHLLLRAADMRGEPEKLAELAASFRFPALAALNGRLTHASDDPQSPRSMLRTMVHVDTELYVDLLKRKATDARHVDVLSYDGQCSVTRNNKGFVEAVKTPDGKTIAADLFVDMEGSFGSDKTSTDSASAILDRMITNVSELLAETGYPAIEAGAYGVLHTTRLRSKSIKTFAYNSQITSDEEATTVLGSSLDVVVLSNTILNRPWHKNLVRAGRASADNLTPGEAGIDLLQYQICRLSELIPVTPDMDIEANEYNRLHMIHHGQRNDFDQFPFLMNTRDKNFWQQARGTKPSENLQIRMNQFQKRGRLVTFDGETHDEQQWLDRMIGFGIVPEKFDPIARAVNMAQVGKSLGQMVDAFKKTVSVMPSHPDYMNRLAALAAKQAPVDEFAI